MISRFVVLELKLSLVVTLVAVGGFLIGGAKGYHEGRAKGYDAGYGDSYFHRRGIQTKSGYSYTRRR